MTAVATPGTLNALTPPVVKRMKATQRAQVVDELNEEHAVLLLGDRPVVLREGEGVDGRPEVRLLSVAGFREWMRPRVAYLEAENGQLRRIEKSKIWIEDERRRQFDGLVFDPSGHVPASYYNLWHGFAVQPAERGAAATCQRFIDHVAENICDGNEALFAWVMGWFAAMFQRPTEKLGTSLVLRGTQGTGKTIVGKHIGSLLGPHYALVADSRYIVGRFNAHLANCLLLQLDEATWGGDHAAAGKLKDLVTGEWQYIEYKGKEPVRVRNYVRLLVTGNNDWLVPAGLEERRFAVLDVAEHRRQDHRYFQAIDDEMANGGREALLRYLLDFDLKDVPLRQIPETLALAEQKVSSLSIERAWWADLLARGVLPGDTRGIGETPCATLYTHYLEYAKQLSSARRMSEIAFGLQLKRLAPGVQRTRRSLPAPGGSVRHWYYAFPPLDACRAEFARLTGDDAAIGDSGDGDRCYLRWAEDTGP